MYLRKSTAFFVSTALFLISSNVAATSLRGFEDDVEPDEVLAEEKAGTFLRAMVEYEGAGHEEIFNIMIGTSIYEIESADVDDELREIPSGDPVIVPKGVSLGGKSGKAPKANLNGATIQHAGPKSGKALELNGVELQPSGEAVAHARTRTREKKSLFGRNLEGRTEEQQRNVDKLHRRLYSTTLGEKSVVAVRVKTTDAEYSHTEAYLSDEVFGTSGDNFNLASGYDQCSFGALTFTPKDYTNGGVSIVDGVVTIEVDVAAGGEDDGVVRQAVTDKITETFGTMTDVADYWMYCLPPGTAGGWIAYAYINHHISVYNNEWCNYPSGQMHELGHNLNFAHSGEGSAQYDDQSGMMGYSYGDDEGPVMCFNAAKSWQSGWYGEDGMHGDKTLESNLIHGCVVETLSGIADYNTTENKVLIKIINPDGNGEDIFVAFNAQKSINSGTVEAGNNVTVVQVNGGGGMSYSESTLRSKLGDGGTYTNPNFGGQSLTIEVESISGSDSANVKIYFGSECIPPEPLVCGNGICESGETFDNCFADCTDPHAVTSDMCQTCYAYDGNMFEVKAKDEDLAITTLSTRTYALSGTSGTFGVEVWTKQGTMIGFEHDPSAWTKIADVSFTAGPWEMLHFPEFATPVHIAAGQTQSFYVTYKGGQGQGIFSYSNPGVNTLVNEDANLQLFHGYYNVNGFGGKGQGTWNGVMTYVTAKRAVETTPLPTSPPSSSPTSAPTSSPSSSPTSAPTSSPSSSPTSAPTSSPSSSPTSAPTPTSSPSSSPTSAPTSSPSSSPTSAPTSSPSSSPTSAPTSSPSSSPTSAPTSPPTSSPTSAPTSSPTSSPSNHPTTPQPTSPPVVGTTPPPTPGPTPEPSNQPTSSPTTQPTNAVTSPPTSNPSSPPTAPPSSSPTNQPTSAPSAPPSSSPTKLPTPVPSSPPAASPSSSPTNQPTSQPTALPTSLPTAIPTSLPTALPTSHPTPQPTGVASKTLVCAKGDVDKLCKEGLTKTAPVNESHEITCCLDCTGIKCPKEWKDECNGFNEDLHALSKIDKECHIGTFEDAVNLCRNTEVEGVKARLCTPEEVKLECASHGGCKEHDKALIWTCSYDGHACTSNEECCGSCLNNVCQGESSFPP